MYHPINTIDQNGGVSPIPTDNPKMERATKSMYKSDQYKRMTPREKRKTPGWKAANREYQKKNKELKKNALRQESIAMENPNYLPEATSFNVDENVPPGSILTHDLTTPEVNGTPLYIESKNENLVNVKTPYMHAHKTQRHHVTHAQKTQRHLFQLHLYYNSAYSFNLDI